MDYSQRNKKRQSSNAKCFGLDWKWWVAILAILLPIIGLGLYLIYLYLTFQMPTIEFKSFDFTETNFEKAIQNYHIQVNSSLSLKLTNNNSFGARIVSINSKIYQLSTKSKLCDGSVSNVDILPNSITDIKIKFPFNVTESITKSMYSECSKNGPNAIKSENNIKLLIFKFIPYSLNVSMEHYVSELCQIVSNLLKKINKNWPF